MYIWNKYFSIPIFSRNAPFSFILPSLFKIFVLFIYLLSFDQANFRSVISFSFLVFLSVFFPSNSLIVFIVSRFRYLGFPLVSELVSFSKNRSAIMTHILYYVQNLLLIFSEFSLIIS
ncbi:hypothetical protein V8G54_020260 [Vigna mungo]|uniref:Uncharacterized protein n=1 Tax=Vigna mungo TaxID=3915 RepID=A0AAQ3NBJ0_VIGMU